MSCTQTKRAGRALLPTLALIGTAIASAQPSTLLLSTQTMTFLAPETSTIPQNQLLSITSTGAPLEVSGSVRYLGTTEGWLSISPSSGSTALTMTVTANPNGLVNGSYVGQVVIAVPGSTQSGVVTVTLTIGGAAPGQLTATPPSVALGVSSGTTSQDVMITFPSTVSISAAANTNLGGPWLSVTPTQGFTPATLTIVANSAGLTPGTTYTGNITVTSPSTGAVVIPVSFLPGGSGNGISLSPASLTYGYQLGMAAPPAQSILVSVSGGVSSYVAQSPVSWLTLTSNLTGTPSQVVTGTVNTNLTAIVDPSSLTIGTYNATLMVSAGTATQNVPVTLVVSQNSILAASPSSLAFSYQPGGAIPPAQQTVISSTGTPVSFTAGASSTGWLSVGPQNGATNGINVLTVAVNPVGLGAGSYNGSISVVSGSSTLVIPVSLTVGSSFSGINASPSQLSFQAQLGSAAVTQALTLSSFTPQSFFTFANSSGSTWLQVSPTSGTTPTILNVTANPAVLTAPGVYSGSIIVTSTLDNSQLTVPVTLTVSGGALTASPASLSFTQGSGGAPPPSQQLQLNAIGAVNYVATSNSAWLSVTPNSGIAPTTLTVNVNGGTLTTGTYSGNISITGGANTVNVPVSLTVSTQALPVLNPTNLTFSAAANGPSPAPQTVSVSSSGGGEFSFSTAVVTSGGNWLSAAASSTTTPATVTVSVSSVGLAPGTYRGSVAVVPSGGGQSRATEVTLVVSMATAPSITSVLHGATLRSTVLSPGLILTVKGSGMGPQTGVEAPVSPAGALPFVLGDTRLLFDGVPAALLYVSNAQINAIVPYGVAGRTSTQVQAELAGVRSQAFELRVQDAAPGVFSMDASGAGQAAAFNQNGTLNSPGNPETAGNAVVLYATGEGQTSPAGQDGRVITTDLRKPLLPVTVTVGGVPVDVLYAGSAPGLVSGALQVNILLNSNVPRGPQQPVEIRVGNIPSPAGIHIAVQ